MKIQMRRFACVVGCLTFALSGIMPIHVSTVRAQTRLYANATPPSSPSAPTSTSRRKGRALRSRQATPTTRMDSLVVNDLGDAEVMPTGGVTMTAGTLTADDVRLVIAQAYSVALTQNLPVTIAVVDREGNPLGVFAMPGAPPMTQLNGGTGEIRPTNSLGLVDIGLNGTIAPSSFAAISKAGTAAFFSTTGNAFTSRTAGFIIQEHIPMGPVGENRPGGPLFGVQFSSLPCTDIKRPALPLGIAGDPGGLPLYKNGVAVGGIAVEGDGLYTVDRNSIDEELPPEEIIAAGAVRGFEPPPQIRGDTILVDGVRLPYINVTNPPTPTPQPFGSLAGNINPLFPIRGAQVSDFSPATLGTVQGQFSNRFAIRASPTVTANSLTASDVTTILRQGAEQASRTRAAIRRPLGSSARVSISVVDTEGRVLGIFRTADAPVFGFDVSVQKARTAAFFSTANAGSRVRAAGLGSYIDRSAADGVMFDGSFVFSDRAIGFLHRPFYPDGIDVSDELPIAPGPLSTPFGEWSVFNVGLQLDLIKRNLERAIAGQNVRCSDIAPGGLQIFAGSVPLFKNGELVGAIGISGDGIDQDDLIASAGSRGYVAPAERRADQIIVRDTRLPFVKFPRNPNL
ncbi:MAG: heme-binding protein [Pyrinomonadaceae bacterium MAG19_C2-C3]|nr:heme-binding protein [Pyrinomonadaceae bacterium MAG19_C2-C3]